MDGARVAPLRENNNPKLQNYCQISVMYKLTPILLALNSTTPGISTYVRMYVRTCCSKSSQTAPVTPSAGSISRQNRQALEYSTSTLPHVHFSGSSMRAPGCCPPSALDCSCYKQPQKSQRSPLWAKVHCSGRVYTPWPGV